MGREVLKRVEKDEVNCAFHDMRRVVSDLEKLVGGTAQAADSFDLLRHVDYVDFRDAFDSLVANRRASAVAIRLVHSPSLSSSWLVQVLRSA